MYPRQNIPGGRKTEKGLLHKTRNEREKCESPYSYAFFGRSVPGKAFSICINYCVFIDPACGSGSLLTLLREKGVTGTGVEIDFAKIVNGVRAKLDVLFEDADQGLGLLPDNTYDVAVLSETLQTVKKPREILVNILDKAKEAIVTIPNFAAIGIRLHLLLTGRMPVGSELPFEWYDTPNTHFFTFKDFLALCRKEGIVVREVRAESSSLIGKLLIALGFRNLGADRVVARLARA